MRILTAVVEIATLPVFHAGQYLTLRRAVALELIRDDDAWHIPQALKELAEKLLRRLLVAAALHQNVKHIVVLVDSAPQVMALAMDGQKDLTEVPLVTWLGSSVPQPIGVVLPKLPTPLADRFVGHGDAAFEQEFLHIAVAQGEAIVEPDPVANDFSGKPVVFVTTIGSKAKLLLHGMKSLCYGDPAAFNSEAFGNQEDHHGLPLACGDNIQTDCVGS